jgi:glycosyltransferase involved in cell wall biosynthesis
MRMPTSIVSVIIPILNMRRYLAEAVDSVRAQTYRDWELLLIDDGSTDGSLDLAADYARRDPARIRVLPNSGADAHGASAARNRGLRDARGEWIAFLDADDIWLPDKLARQTGILREHPHAAMTFARVRYFHDTGDAEERDQPFGSLRDGLYPAPNLACAFLLDADIYPCPSATLIAADALRAVGGFEERFQKVRTDLAVWVKLSARFPVHADSAILVRYRQHADSSVARLFRDEAQYNANEMLFAEWLAAHIEPLPASQRGPLEEIACARLFRSHLVRLRARGVKRWRWPMFQALWQYPVYRRNGRILKAMLPSGWQKRNAR